MVTIGDRSAGRDNNFNAIRMAAAFSVLVSHAYPITLGTTAPQPLESVLHGMTLGNVSVFAFFAVSGFFITRSFSNKKSLAVFLRARVLRLFPALIVVLMTTLLAASFFTTESGAKYWGAAPSYFTRNVTLFFLQYQMPGVFTANPYGPPINGSLWTLNYEVLCYLGVVAFGTAGLLASRRFSIVVAIFLACYIGAMMLELHPRLDALVRLAFPFILGMAFWVWRNHIPVSPILAVAGFAIAATGWTTTLFGPLFVIAFCYAVFVVGYANLPVISAYRRLGDYSYGIYIYAFPIQQGAVYLGVDSPIANIAVAAPLTLACAALSWHCVEQPCLKIKRSPNLEAAPA